MFVEGWSYKELALRGAHVSPEKGNRLFPGYVG